jgi:hypothetical protein
MSNPYPFKVPDVKKVNKVKKPCVKKLITLLPYSTTIEPGRVLVTLPLQIVNEANCFEKWQVKAGRHKAQKELVSKYLLLVKDVLQLPCSITIIRIAPRELDRFDNLPYSCKWVLDSVCNHLIPGLQPGRADGDPRIKNVIYHQEKAGINEYGARIEFIY